MSVEQNRAIALQFLQRMKHCRGIDEALITEDFQWWTPGMGFVDKTKMQQIISTLDQIMPQMPDMTITGTTAEGNRVAIEASGSCELANGKRYANTYHFLIELQDGRVRRVKEYMDTKLAHDIFGSETPQPQRGVGAESR
jgi:uncharacterized protein